MAQPVQVRNVGAPDKSFSPWLESLTVDSGEDWLFQLLGHWSGVAFCITVTLLLTIGSTSKANA